MRGDAQRFEYVITFDNIAVQGIDGAAETPTVAHRDPPAGAQSKPSSEARREPSDEPRPELSALLPSETVGVQRPAPLIHPQSDQGRGSPRPEGVSPRVTSTSLERQVSFAPGRGSLNPSFVQEGFLVEAFWAVKTGAGEAYFKRAHFHPPDLSTGFEAQHLGHPNELHGIFIQSLDGKLFGLKSLRYRVTRNRQIPNKPISIEGFSNFNVNVLVARTFDPRGPIRAPFVSFPVGLPVGNDTSLPWWTLRIFGFELVKQVYIASSASVDFDNIVLTRSEPPPAPPERREDEK
ncbi:MAG: hypothetical protein Q7W02_16035 [Candidatus Rokubacteria bacterium]|nr:hypothetical protein [Candidatus Rokubacteria bacterium]